MRSFLVTLLSLFLIACVEYEAPPEVQIEQPADGIYRTGDPITLLFSEPVRRGTFGIRVWQGERDIELDLLATSPLLHTCGLSESPCGDATLAMADDRMSATILLDSEGLGQPDVPLALEVVAGLTNDLGSDRIAPAWFDFQFKPNDADIPDPVEPIEFEDGVYMIVAVIDEPLPTVISLMSHFIATEDGRIAMVGAEADELGDAPRNTKDPEQLEIDVSDQGFAVFAEGTIRENEDGRFIATDPFPIRVTLGPIVVDLTGVRFNGFLLPGEDGHENIEGTLSFETLILDTGVGDPFEYEASSTTFCANFVPPELVPEGTPEICGDQCGGAVGGTCLPPEGFPLNGICDEGSGESE